MREVGGLRNRRVAILLESSLHPHVPLGSDVVRRHENALPLLRHFIEVDVPFLGDLLHQLVRIPTFLLRDRDEVLVHIRHQHARLIAHERDGEEWLDARRAAGDDRNRSSRGDGVDVAIAQ